MDLIDPEPIVPIQTERIDTTSTNLIFQIPES